MRLRNDLGGKRFDGFRQRVRVAGLEVSTACKTGDFSQLRFIELFADRAPFRAAVRVDGMVGVSAADADRVDDDAILRRRFGGYGRRLVVLRMIDAVGQQDDGLRAEIHGFQRTDRQLDGVADGGAVLQIVRRDLLHPLFQNGGPFHERADEIGPPREGDKAYLAVSVIVG